MGYIYKISNSVNDKVYIGQTIQLISERWKTHLFRAKNNYKTHNFRGKNNKANNYKVSDDELAASLANSTSIRQAVMKLGLAETVGALYPRCYKIMAERQITLLPKN